ncbi:c-type cytochrome [uncultured Croceitalea sp.]|uniref:c-type cytochrome n=1 Tax=uncultured Croceitalea sp. TaxID=1798908 RepID=UPI00374F4CC0
MKSLNTDYKTIFVLLLLAIMISCGEKKEKKEDSIIKRPKTEVAKKEPKQKMSAGARAFIQCAACHNLKEGQPNKVGPNLYGIFGRPAASLENFTYSEALTNSGIVWDEEKIRNWLSKPSDYVPGTTMAFIGIKNEEQQIALIKYLKEETK